MTWPGAPPRRGPSFRRQDAHLPRAGVRQLRPACLPDCAIPVRLRSHWCAVRSRVVAREEFFQRLRPEPRCSRSGQPGRQPCTGFAGSIAYLVSQRGVKRNADLVYVHALSYHAILTTVVPTVVFLATTCGWLDLNSDIQELVRSKFRILSLVARTEWFGTRARVWQAIEMSACVTYFRS